MKYIPAHRKLYRKRLAFLMSQSKIIKRMKAKSPRFFI